MQDEKPEQHWLSRFALPVSAGLHLAILALLIFGLPHALQKPEKDEAVDVALVPPPEQPPKPKTEPPAPKPEAEKPPEKKTEPPPPPLANKAPAAPSPAPSFNPVVQYGEKDSGPKKSLEGNSAEEEAKPPDPQPAPDEQAAAEKDDTAADDAETELALPDAAAAPSARPEETATKPDATKPSAPKLRKAKKLFSPSANGASLATTAMGDLPRSARGATLCVSELREQLLRNAPPYFADLLPSSPLKDGNVIDVPGVAFRANGQWRDLSYRCEVDTDATKVVSFAYRIGEPIPRGQWQQRGLPSR